MPETKERSVWRLGSLCRNLPDSNTRELADLPETKTAMRWLSFLRLPGRALEALANTTPICKAPSRPVRPPHHPVKGRPCLANKDGALPMVLPIFVEGAPRKMAPASTCQTIAKLIQGCEVHH